MFNINHLSKKLTLKKEEKSIIPSFLDRPNLNHSLQVLMLLKRQNLVVEYLEFLRESIAHFPKYTILRIMLAEAYYSRGLISECWMLLIHSPQRFTYNYKANVLLFKCSVLLDNTEIAFKVLKVLTMTGEVDKKTKYLFDILSLEGINFCKDKILQEFIANGIPISVQKDDNKQTSGVAFESNLLNLELKALHSESFKVDELSHVFAESLDQKPQVASLENFFHSLKETLNYYEP